MKKFIKCCLIVCSLGTLNSYAFIEQMRKDLIKKDEALEKKYAIKIQEYIDSGEKYEGKKVQGELKKYSLKRKEIFTDATNKDTRHVEINEIERKFKGKIQNTGSNPKNPLADVDFAASNKDSYQEIKKYYADKGYTVEDEGYKLEIVENDTVVWANEESLTPEQRKLKLKDHDSYNTTGGQHSTGVRNNKIQSSIHGAVLDPESKMIHSLPEGNDGKFDVKTYGKGFAKLQEQGLGINEIQTREIEYIGKDGKKKKQKIRVLQKSLKVKTDLYNKAKILQNYGNPVEAGIYEITDSKKIKKEKMDAFIQETLIETEKTKNIAKQKAQKKNVYRQILIDSVKEPNLKQRMQERLDLNKESSRQVEKSNQKDLSKTNYDKSKIKTNPIVRKNTRVAGFSAASFLTSAYQLSEDAEKIKKEGGNRFIEITDKDTIFSRNAKAYGSAMVESTPFGGAWNAGVQAEAEEKQRILDATKKGKSVNPVVSMARSTGYGLWYLAKGMVTGTFEYTSEKVAKLAWEIKLTNDEYEVERKAIEQSIKTEEKLVLLKKKKELDEKKKKRVIFFEDDESILEKENAFRKSMDNQRERKAQSDNYRAKKSLQSATIRAGQESDSFKQAFRDTSDALNKMGEEYTKQMAQIQAQDALRREANRKAFDTTALIRKQNQQMQQRNLNIQASNGFGGKYADTHAQGLQSSKISRPKRNYEAVGTLNNKSKMILGETQTKRLAYKPTIKETFKKPEPTVTNNKPKIKKKYCGYDISSSGKWKREYGVSARAIVKRDKKILGKNSHFITFHYITPKDYCKKSFEEVYLGNNIFEKKRWYKNGKIQFHYKIKIIDGKERTLLHDEWNKSGQRTHHYTGGKK
ncbi:MAG: hypothetical protein ACNI28_01405 [Arcobacter sp.]|uniref:hypothetical protein n=1 Tax=Arcobacter sp. TaxID=1872629 RepID=UPI003B004B17